MTRTYKTRLVAIDKEVCGRLEDLKQQQAYRGSFTAYVTEILDLYSQGKLERSGASHELRK